MPSRLPSPPSPAERFLALSHADKARALRLRALVRSLPPQSRRELERLAAGLDRLQAEREPTGADRPE